jgi:hypothetical protein
VGLACLLTFQKAEVLPVEDITFSIFIQIATHIHRFDSFVVGQKVQNKDLTNFPSYSQH